jgi:phosphatidylglycerol---prolipoprotein diacylglyceryl transferase
VFPSFKLGPLPTLYSFGLMVVVGYLSGAYLAAWLARKRGLDGEAFLDGSVVILFASIAGARLLFVLLNWREYSHRLLEIGALWQGGMSFHGGFLAGLGAGIAFMKVRKLPILAMADAAAPGIAIGYALGRIGCFLNGCCYGGPTDLPWGVRFPHSEAPGIPHHPAQLYASILNLAFVPFLIWLYNRPHQAGQVMATFGVLYSTYRFGIESLRKGVTAEVFAFGLTEAQVLSLVTLAASAAWWIWLRKHGQPAPEAEPDRSEGKVPEPVAT